ncbi:hypothetical protein RJ641_021752 [Dillenia turbinata]|uniref:Uncharacterized protein n=1 Tax=Dillenia turbinata TaxID=194707 RepID=A0AAN8YVE2_9MAGN
MLQLLANYPLVFDEDDPDWPEDADGWGFKLGQFFDQITTKNVRKADDDYNYDGEMITIFAQSKISPLPNGKKHRSRISISPLIVLVHNRYKRLPLPRLDLVSALQVSVFPEVIFTKAGKILSGEKVMRSAVELSKMMAFFYYEAAKPPYLTSIDDRQALIPSVSNTINCTNRIHYLQLSK